MNILIVSQCTKNALVQTRRILDQFSERCGTRTWQTHITLQGLETLRSLLKATARRNTAVACHWIRGKDNTELLWIVGNPNSFGEKGVVPTNITKKNILRKQDENDWHTLLDIQILSAIAALFHDFGKACLAFQLKLKKNSKKPSADVYRHEWISLRLFQAFVGGVTDDQNWLSRLATLNQDFNGLAEKLCIDTLIKDGITQLARSPFINLPSMAKAVAWLILTHHRLPQRRNNNGYNHKELKKLLEYLGPEWNDSISDSGDTKDFEKNMKACWQFTGELKLPFSSVRWRERASYWGDQALKRIKVKAIDWIDDLYSLHLARLSLMLADHHYSSLPAHSNLGDANFPLYANTDRETGKLKQRLDEHLVGVAKHAKRIVEILPSLEQVLPCIARHKGFKQRESSPLFRWQNQAYDLACSLRERTKSQGFFGVNMASTGCGKTFANARIMYGLANPNLGARFCIALGLRTLTLQTGEAYRERLKLGADDLAILVGSIAVKELFDLGVQQNEKSQQDNEKPTLESCGSESAESLMSDDGYVHYEGSLAVGPLKYWLDKKPEAKKLLSVPILTCTIDHLIGATEATRGGKQIAPMLRLMTSDLVLDELDDFDIADLPALTRLVHWAGMLGSRVLLSSATLPPAIVEGLFNAYHAGRTMFQKSRGVHGRETNISCAWFDENNATSEDHTNDVSFIEAHNQFVARRVEKLRHAEIRRQAIIKPLNIDSQESSEVRPLVANAIYDMLHELHLLHHTVDEETGKRVSFGLIRLANIDPLIDIARHLFKLGAKENYRIKLCCYHSRHPLLVRSNIEQRLDRLLNRRETSKSIFEDKELRKALDGCDEDNLIYIVLASPVAEVGRDHDYDWAIVEPSSMRSLIQLAGRIRRHRAGICTQPNIYILNTNIRSLENRNGSATYCWPGFETKDQDGRFLLQSHKLDELLVHSEYENINATPRICARELLEPQKSLVDLEHARLRSMMLNEPGGEGYPVSLWWESQAAFGGALQQATRFRQSLQQCRFALLLDDEEEKFFDLEGEPPKQCDSLFKRIALKIGDRIEAWGGDDYSDMLNNLAEQLGQSIEYCGRRFGWIDLDKQKNNNWCYNPILGICRDKK